MNIIKVVKFICQRYFPKSNIFSSKTQVIFPFLLKQQLKTLEKYNAVFIFKQVVQNRIITYNFQPDPLACLPSLAITPLMLDIYIIKGSFTMYCMCCKLRHAASARLPQKMDQAPSLQLPVLSPLAKNPLGGNPYNDLLSGIKELNQQHLLNALQKQVSGLKSTSKFGEDLEQTNLSEQATEDERLYRLLFRRIYVENFTAERLIREDIRLLERVSYPESLQRILIETIDKAAIIYRSILKEKVEQIAACTTIGKQVTMRDFYHYFEEVLDMINVIIDYGKAIRTYSHEADHVLRYLESSSMVDPMHEIHEHWLHRRCIRTVLQDGFLKSLCALARAMLKTNSLAKYQTKGGIEELEFLVQCCFEEDCEQLLLSRSCSQFPFDDEDDQALKLMRQATPNIHRLQCEFTPQFLKSIERKVRKHK